MATAEQNALLICDTSGLVALFDSSDRHHQAVSRVVEEDDGPYIVSPYVIAEVDYLLATRRGVRPELAALRELGGGAWDLPTLDPADVCAAADVIERYQDQEIGLTDASMVVLAQRYATDRLLTFDHRHFRIVRPLDGGAFRLLPDYITP